MTENSLKKVKVFHKFIFGSSAVLIASCFAYKYLCENKPEMIRSLIFNKYFDKKHKELFDNKRIVNYYSTKRI